MKPSAIGAARRIDEARSPLFMLLNGAFQLVLHPHAAWNQF